MNEAPETSSIDTPRYVRLTVLVLLLAALLRCAFIVAFPPGPDECMYWAWSKQLDLSYVDHPPMVAYAIALMTEVFGDTPWAPRILALMIASAAGWLLFCTARLLFDARVGFWAATLHAACPMFSMAGGVMLLPETLLMLWITLALYLSARLVLTDRLKWFYLIGVVFGCGWLSKYPAVLIPAALALFAMCSRPHHRWFARKEPYLMVLIGLILFSPVILWNIEHQGAGLAFLDRRTQSGGEAPGLAGIWQILTAQAAYHSPVTYALLLWGTVVAAYRGLVGRDRRFLLLFCFSGPVIFLFLMVSAFRTTLPHWPAAGYLAAYITAPAALLASFDRSAKSARRRSRLLAVSAIVGAVECLLMPLVMIYPLTTVAYRRFQGVVGLPPDVIEPMAEAYGWDGEIRERILSLRDRIGPETVVLTHYHMVAALLHRALYGECEVVSLHADAYQYDIWYDDDDLLGKTVIYVSSENSEKSRGEPEDFYRFEQCVREPDLPIIRYGVQINEIHFWVCSGYQGPVTKSPSD